MEEANLLYTSISLIIFLFAFKIFLLTKKKHKNLPPSPPSLPIIGHLHLLKHPIHRTLHQLSQKHGPILTLWFASRRVVIVSSATAAEECFTKNDIVFANRPKFLTGKHLGYNYTNLVDSPYGDHWRNLRRIGSFEIFSSIRLNMFAGLRRDENKRFLRKLSENSMNDFAKVELKSMLSELTLNIIMRMVAGKRYYGDDEKNKEESQQFKDLIKELFTLGGASNAEDFFPFMNWITNQRFKKRLIKLFDRTDPFLQDLIEEHRKEMESKNTLIDHLLSLQQKEPGYYTDELIKGFILVILLAGSDTSAVTMEWVLAALLNNPHALEKAKAEIDNNIGQQDILEEEDLSKLPYLHNVISETFRLYPTAPLLIPHYSSEDCIVDGYEVPRDTILLVNAWAMHRDPTLWSESESFKPERFEQGYESNGKQLILPFGMGRRACPGVSLAQRVVGLTLGSIIQCFEWKRISDEEIDMTEGKGVSMPKAMPLEAMCKARPILQNACFETMDSS